ncbi:MAG: PIN/TRAM domain-containing protein [Fimbriimonas sp.]
MSLPNPEAKAPKHSLRHFPWGRLFVITVFVGLFGTVFGNLATFLLDALFKFINRGQDSYNQNPITSVVPMALLGGIIGGYIGNRVGSWLESLVSLWDKMEVGDKVTFFIGIFAGLVASVPFMVLFQTLSLDPTYRVLIILGLLIGFTTLSVFAIQSMAEVLPWNRNTRSRGKRTGIKLLDTNVIIDGRIYDVAKTGFLEGKLYVPGFVLDELQYIADSHDSLRRQRGRRGLEVLRHMQADFPMEVRVYDRYAPDQGDGVDARLVRLAKAMGGDILTNDWNLNRVASLQEVKVLNLNDLALSMRSNIMPQETMELTLIKEGSQPGQGVGYLEDGTMVVVENGRPHIGDTVPIVVSQVIQTERGKMLFAEVDGEPPELPRRRPSPKRNQL